MITVSYTFHLTFICATAVAAIICSYILPNDIHIKYRCPKIYIYGYAYVLCKCIYGSVDRFVACEMNVSMKTIAGILWAQMKPNKICRFNFKLRYFCILWF